ncbi:MAG: insulinase family protein [Cyanobacteriota/Melainabacteria group bacterium]
MLKAMTLISVFRTVTCFALAFLMLSAGAPAVIAAETQSSVINRGGTVIVLQNGLRVILVNQPAFPLTSCQLWYHQGSDSEPEGYRGACYALKHVLSLDPMMANQKAAIKLFKSAAQFDSFASEDFTAFAINSVKENLPEALKIQAARLNSKLDNTQVVLDGLSESTKKHTALLEPTDYERLENEIRSLASGRGKHPEHQHRINNVKKVKEYYQASFMKAPVTLVIAGNFDSAAVLKSIQENFAGARILQKPKPPQTNWQPGEREKSFTKFITGDTNYIAVAFKVPGVSNSDIAPLVVLESLLANKVNGILKNRFITDSTCKAASAKLELRKEHGLFRLQFASDQSVDPKLVMTDLDSLIQTLQDVSIDSISLNRARQRAYLRYLKHLGGPYDAAYHHGYFEALENHNLIAEWKSILDKVKEEDIIKVAKKYLTVSNRTVGIYKTKVKTAIKSQESSSESEDSDHFHTMRNGTSVPATKSIKEVAHEEATNLVNKRPVEANVGPILFPSIKPQQKKLANGIKLVLYPVKGSQIVSLTGSIQLGAVHEPQTKRGVSQLNTALMNGDSVNISLERSRVLQSNKGLSQEDLLSFTSGPEYTTFHCNFFKDNLRTLTKLLSHHMRFPDLSDAKFERARALATSTVMIENSLSRDKLKNHLMRNLLDKNSTYAPVQVNRLVSGIDKLTPEDVTDYRKKWLKPGSTVIVAVGDMDLNTLSSTIEPIFADWKPDGGSEPVSPPVQLNPRQILKIILPEVSDSRPPELVAGRLIEEEGDSGFADMALTNCALFEHPIYARLSRSRFGPYLDLNSEKLGDHCLWWSKMTGRKNVLEDTFSAFKKSVYDLENKGIDDMELKELKDFLIRRSVIRGESDIFTIADTVLKRLNADRSIDIARSVLQRGKADLNQFIKDTLKPERSCVVFELNKNSRNLARKLNLNK